MPLTQGTEFDRLGPMCGGENDLAVSSARKVVQKAYYFPRLNSNDAVREFCIVNAQGPRGRCGLWPRMGQNRTGQATGRAISWFSRSPTTTKPMTPWRGAMTGDSRSARPCPWKCNTNSP